MEAGGIWGQFPPGREGSVSGLIRSDRLFLSDHKMVLAGASRDAHIQGMGRFPAASGCFRLLAGVRHLEAGVAQWWFDLDRMQDDAQLLGPSNGRRPRSNGGRGRRPPSCSRQECIHASASGGGKPCGERRGTIPSWEASGRPDPFHRSALTRTRGGRGTGTCPNPRRAIPCSVARRC